MVKSGAKWYINGVKKTTLEVGDSHVDWRI